jgi:hypothetical protein
MCVNAGSPVWREPHGDGVPIVPQRLGECPIHGEGEQVRVFFPEREQVVECVNPARCLKGMVLTRESEQGKLEGVDLAQKGKGPCKRHSAPLRESLR